MNALIFILKRSLLNTIKNMLKKPAILIPYIIIAAFTIFGSIMAAFNKETSHKPLEPDIVMTILVAYTLFILFISVAVSFSGGNSIFRMADVNMLFTAPIKAGNILIYGFMKQLAINIIVMIFISLQYPNWKRMFGFIDGAGIVLAVGYIILLTLSSVLGIVVYSFVSRKPGRRKALKGIFICLLALFLSPVIVRALQSGDILKSLVEYFSSEGIKYIPVIGWLRQVLTGTLYGVSSSVVLNLLYLLLLEIGILLYIYKMDTGFYEDALSGAEIRETMIKSAREGKSDSTYSQNRKFRKVNFRFTLEGGKAIFQRQMLEQRKTGLGFIGIRTLVLFCIAIVTALMIDVDGDMLLAIFLAFSVYIMMIFNMIGTWEGELSKHYIYLIPASAFSKMLYSTIPIVIKLLIEGAIIFCAAGILVHSSALTILTAASAYTMIGASFTYSDVFARRLFGSIHGKILRVFVRIAVLLIILASAISVSTIIIVATGIYSLAFFVASLINLVLTALFMLGGVGLFENPEFD
jgi:hypothetical protein